MHAVMVEYSNSERSAEDILEGSLRRTGFKDGAVVTVVGQKFAANSITPVKIFGGDRDALVKDLETEAA